MYGLCCEVLSQGRYLVVELLDEKLNSGLSRVQCGCLVGVGQTGEVRGNAIPEYECSIKRLCVRYIAVEAKIGAQVKRRQSRCGVLAQCNSSSQ